MNVLAGSTDVTTYFHLRLAADGTDATGLTIANIDLQYVRSGATPAAKVDATALAATNTAHTDNYAIEVDATDQPGVYRVDWPDAAFAAAVREVILTVKCATAFTESLRVAIVGYNPADGVRLGLTALPNAAADAAGGLPISDAGGLDLDAQIGTDLDAILVDTAEIGAAGAGLTAINLPNQTMDIVGNITGNLSGTVGSVTGAVGSVTGAVGSVTGAVGSVTGFTAANIATILALLDDARGEPGQGAPPVNPDLATKVDYLYKFLRNKVTSTATTISIYADDGATVDHKSTQSDDATTYIRGEIVSGP